MEENKTKNCEQSEQFGHETVVSLMPAFDIREFEINVVGWNLKNFGGHFGSGYRLLLGCMEELGELTHAHLKGEQGIRHTPEEILAMKKDAIGDLTVFLLNYCDSQKINYVECLELVWSELQKRDWTKNKLSGQSN